MIREARLADLPDLMEMGKVFYETGDLAAFGPFNEVKNGWEEWFKTCIKSDKCLVLLCIEDGKPIGFLTGMLVPMPWSDKAVSAVETGWYVDKEYRGKGYGKRLLIPFLDWAAANLVKMVNVGTAENATKTGNWLQLMGLKPNEKRFIGIL